MVVVSAQPLTFSLRDLSLTDLPVVRAAAEQGDAVAQAELGLRYQKGKSGLPVDNKLAAAWYEKAVAQGDVTAIFNLGSLYFNGDLGSRDVPRALALWKRSGELIGRSAHLVADILYRGNGVPKDEAAGVLWYRKAAELNEADAQLFLGDLYWDGKGVEESRSKALEWYIKAAEQKHPRAAAYAGDCYDKGMGTAVDHRRAKYFYEIAAQADDAYGQVKLGEYEAKGLVGKARLNVAVDWWEKAAKQGHEEGERLYKVGLEQLKIQRVNNMYKLPMSGDD
jgi:TPR repeat protein